MSGLELKREEPAVLTLQGSCLHVSEVESIGLVCFAVGNVMGCYVPAFVFGYVFLMACAVPKPAACYPFLCEAVYPAGLFFKCFRRLPRRVAFAVAEAEGALPFPPVFNAA